MAIYIQKDLTSLTLEEIHQMALETVDKLCYNMNSSQTSWARREISIKLAKGHIWKSNVKSLALKTASITVVEIVRKKKHGKLSTEKKKKKKNFKFFKWKKVRGKSNHQRCFIYNKRCHLTKNCPQNKVKAIEVISTLNLNDNEEVESIYFEKSSLDESLVRFWVRKKF